MTVNATRAYCFISPEYITGDRFSSEFIEKRRVSLANYMKRLAKHPLISQSQILRRFLESNEIVPEFVAKSGQSHVFDNISETLLNAFSKVKNPDTRFTDFKQQLDKFQETLISLERLHSKLIRSETEFELDMLEVGSSITTLGLMETQITGPLTDFGNTLRNLCTVLRERINHEDFVYLTNVQEYIGLCMSAKDTLRVRDQKQTDWEELVGYLDSHRAERQRALNPQRGGGGIASFLTSKFQEMQGVDQERARQQKILKLSSKITEVSLALGNQGNLIGFVESQLQEAVQGSSEVSKAFNREMIREMDFFERMKLEDLKIDLKEYAANKVAYYAKPQQYQANEFVHVKPATSVPKMSQLFDFSHFINASTLNYQLETPLDHTLVQSSSLQDEIDRFLMESASEPQPINSPSSTSSTLATSSPPHLGLSNPLDFLFSLPVSASATPSVPLNPAAAGTGVSSGTEIASTSQSKPAKSNRGRKPKILTEGEHLQRD
ncbi:intercellular trafficking and secretion [Entophlyctis sp. JEL0112]|nr:intercellular trafficking and secretion [Entophlyctis sp. JEL0112]